MFLGGVVGVFVGGVIVKFIGNIVVNFLLWKLVDYEFLCKWEISMVVIFVESKLKRCVLV